MATPYRSPFPSSGAPMPDLSKLNLNPAASRSQRGMPMPPMPLSFAVGA